MKKKDTGYELKKVLMIVEDFDFIRNIIGKYFQAHSYNIISAGNMQEAMAIGQFDQPNIIFIDFDMVSNDPYLIVSILHNILPLCQIILIDGRSRHCHKEEAYTAGVHKIMERIFNLSDLDELVIGKALEAIH